jgi:hypothetical protein
MNWLKDHTNSMLVISVGLSKIENDQITLEEVAREVSERNLSQVDPNKLLERSSSQSVETAHNIKASSHPEANMMLTYELIQQSHPHNINRFAFDNVSRSSDIL